MASAAPSTSPLNARASRHFISWLADARLSLAFTTYQTNRLFLIGLKSDGRLSIFERNFDRPMGLHATSERLIMSTRFQIWTLDDALPAGEQHDGFDRVYVPRHARTTGDLDTHDIATDAGVGVVFVNTAYSCLATTSEKYSFRPLWQPPFISRLAPEDRCHLNGLAMGDDGMPAYVTAVSRSDVVAGWRERRHAGGMVIDVRTGEIVLEDMSMPHSPRLHQGKLWVLNSGTGELGWVDVGRRRFEPVAFCPGFLRGLAFAGDFAIVGLSKQRQERTFSGLALDDRLKAKDADARCGLWVIDLKSGVVAHWLELEGVVIELYDVQVLPGVKRPMALGFKTDEIQRLITIDAPERPILQALSTVRAGGGFSGAGGGGGRIESGGPGAAARVQAPGAPGEAGQAGSAVTTGRATPGAGGLPPTNPPRAAAPNTAAAEAEYRAANHLLQRGNAAGAVQRYQQALALDPEHVRALGNLGSVYGRLGRRDAARQCYERALALDPAAVFVRRNLGLLLQGEGDHAGAIAHFEAALQHMTANSAEVDGKKTAEILNLLGLALYESGLLDAAKQSFERATKAAPEAAEAYNNWAGVLKVEERLDEALALHEKAAELAPDFFVAHENIGKIREDQCRVPEAKAAYARALALRADPALALHCELLCPPVFESAEALERYRDHAEAVIDDLTRAGRAIELAPERVQSSRSEPPFDWAYHGRDNLALKVKYAALFARGFAFSADRDFPPGFVSGSLAGLPPSTPSPARARTPSRSDPWRVGFVVTAGHEGVFARCMSGILKHLDPSQFRSFLILSRARAEALRGPMQGAPVHYVNLPLRFDQAVLRLRALELDAIYYWEVGTDSTNYFLPFLRLAPVQCTGWGWPETSAAPELDYHLTSAELALPDIETRFSEKLVRLPELPPYFYRSPIPERPHAPSHFGLPDDAHLYVCAQTLRKMHPDLDALVGDILRRDRRGVAVFVADTHPTPGDLLRARWRVALPDVLDRVVLLPRLSPEDYFHLIGSAHVSLDTLYFGGSNTAYDCIAAGVPMVTLPTEQPRGRYVAALLRRVGANECIAQTTDDYVEKAVALGTDAALRAEIGSRIRAHAPGVFETRAAVTQLEHFLVGALAAAT